MFLPPWADNHSYATESARQCKNGLSSLPLQCIQETKKITVHSRVRADIKCADRPQCRPIVRPRPMAGLWSPIPSIWSAIASLRHAARLLFDRCTTAPETRPLPAVSCAHPAHDVDRLSSGVRRGEVVIPWPVVWRPLCFPGRAPPYPLPAVLGAPLPAMLIVRRRRWGPVIGRERRRVRPDDRPTLRTVGTFDVCSNASVNSDLSCFLHRGRLKRPYLHCRADSVA